MVDERSSRLARAGGDGKPGAGHAHRGSGGARASRAAADPGAGVSDTDASATGYTPASDFFEFHPYGVCDCYSATEQNSGTAPHGHAFSDGSGGYYHAHADGNPAHSHPDVGSVAHAAAATNPDADPAT